MSAGPAVLIPVKAFVDAKARLGDALDTHRRQALARSLATAVVLACAPLPVHVAADDDEVCAWAESLGAHPIRCPEPGLIPAVRHGMAVLTALGHDRVLVTHADLSDPTGLPALVELDGTVLVPDRRLDGTNVIVVATDQRFVFGYGPGSFARHLSEAERIGGPIHIVRDPGLALDVDEPADLADHRAAHPEPGGPDRPTGAGEPAGSPDPSPGATP
jgi:2-phospho-L-lactate/phosphoenolpyruvate guanylyltransferase